MKRGLTFLTSLMFLASVPTGCRVRDAHPISLLTIDAVAGLATPVRVVVDRHGIPHVYASRREDAAFAMGWLHARDRFLQMDIYRRGGHGTLAEILGSAALKEDRQARTIGLHRSARTAWKILNAKQGSLEARIVRAYTAGVNRFLEFAGLDDLPDFYQENGLTPKPWTEVDCFAVYKKFTAELCFSLDDILLQVVSEGLGREAADELFPIERDARIPVVRHPIKADAITGLRFGDATRGTTQDEATRQSDRAVGAEQRPAPEDAVRQLALDTECREILERHAGIPRRMATRNMRASNAWVLHGKLSSNGKPILCVDPHMGFSHPALFYTMHIATPGLGVVGATVPGLPFVVFGHNGFVAWAFSNSLADVTDFYVETFDKDDPDRYLYRGRWRRVDKQDEIIHVRDGDDVTFTVRRTIHGPILNEHGKLVAVKWMGVTPSSEVASFLRMNAARNLRQFLDAQRDYVSPVLNFVYADTLGSIAVRTSGWIPRRARGKGRYPVDGSRGEFDWRVSPVPFEEMPLSVNPDEAYLIAANQPLLAPDSPNHYYFGWQFDPGYRARRIDEVLGSGRRFTPTDMVRLQLDSVDMCFRDLVPLLLQAFPEPPDEPEERLALRLLQGWDGRVQPRRVEPTIAWKWLQHFSEAVWADSWDAANLSRETEWLFSDGNWQPPLDVLLTLSLQSNDSEWFDILDTPEVEDRNTIMRQSFRDAVRSLVAEFGPGLNDWTWAKRNRMVIPDLVEDPNLAKNVGAVSGNGNTVSPGGTGGAVTRGAVYRLVIPLGDLQGARAASPGTLAGVPPGRGESALFSEHLQAYLSGTYVPLYYYSYFGDFPADNIAQLVTFAPEAKGFLRDRFRSER